MADIFDEIDEDLRAERARVLVRRWGALGAVVLVLVLLGVGGWRGWVWWKDRESAAVAGPFLAAMRTADALPPGPDPARLPAADSFASLAAKAPPGYRSLAQLREAGLRWDAGDSAAALALWDRVAADAPDPILQDLATLLWAQHAVDHADPAAVSAHTAKLEGTGRPWRALALEVDAELALRQSDTAKATSLLRGLTVDPQATDGLRQRAASLLQLIGASPAAAG